MKGIVYSVVGNGTMVVDVKEVVKSNIFKQALADYEGVRQELKDGCVCDCTKNYGKSCKHPDKYTSGGCK